MTLIAAHFIAQKSGFLFSKPSGFRNRSKGMYLSAVTVIFVGIECINALPFLTLSNRANENTGDYSGVEQSIFVLRGRCYQYGVR